MGDVMQLTGEWSDWAVLVREMPAAREVIVTRARLVVMAPGVSRDPVGHAVAHLELGHHRVPGGLSVEMERWAQQLTDLQGLAVA